MKFTDLEILMNENEIHSLADIARALDTTPQAVSNWKSRDQVPHHIVSKLGNLNKSGLGPEESHQKFQYHEDGGTRITDLLLIIANQLKIILIVPFIFIFLTFTYIQFFQKHEYISSAKILIVGDTPQNNFGGLAGIANQFGVNLPSSGSGLSDLSSPHLLPDILRSRTFAKKILVKEFYTNEHGLKLPLYKILTHGKGESSVGIDTLIAKATVKLKSKFISYSSDPTSPFGVIRITAPEPLLAKKIAEVVIAELEALNRYFKSQHVRDKIKFIENRISAVEKELESSEKKLKIFNEQNRQITSPALQLELDRLTRDVEIQKGIYITLKQQFELAKIEEIQAGSIISILDYPQIPLGPISKNLILRVTMAFIMGLVIALIISFSRSFANTDISDDRKKLLRTKNLLRKKIKDFFIDPRITGTISILMIFGLPFYLGYESKAPVFFGLYSEKLMFIISLYILTLFIFIILFIRSFIKKK